MSLLQYRLALPCSQAGLRSPIGYRRGVEKERERERGRRRPWEGGAERTGWGPIIIENDCKFLHISCWSFKSGPAAQKRKSVANVLVFAIDWGTRRRAIHTRHPPTVAG